MSVLGLISHIFLISQVCTRGVTLKKIMRSHEKVKRKSCEIHEKVNRKSREIHEKVMREPTESHEKVMRTS